MTKNTFFAYFIALVILTLVPVVVSVPPLYSQFQDNLEEIDQQLPDFSTAEGQLETDAEEYIHLTDTVSLYFDPNNNLSDDNTIERNVELNFSPINLALTEEHFEIYVFGVHQAIAYDSLPDFNADEFSNLLATMTETNLTVILAALFTIFAIAAIILAYQLLLIILTNYFIAIFYQNTLRLTDITKISILSLTIPTIAITIARLVGIDSFFSGQLITIFSVILFFLSVRRYKKENKAT